MVDPTSDLGEDVTEETAPCCAACSEPIVNEPTHKVLTRIEDGSILTMHFCDTTCRAEWSE
ncbi:hypothetical protein [Natronomonas sp.]|jgi:hypothetical protein|uniref:DUF7576 family protein n=1 Tax=Natronomonas sp. TaxID=2184060 RepID=UPI0039891629